MEKYLLRVVANMVPCCSAGSSHFTSLPHELVDDIVAHVGDTDVADIVALALTNIYFFRLLVSTARDALIKDSAPWAGDRLILTGDYASGIPSGVITDREFAAWKTEVSNKLEMGVNEDRKCRHNPLYFLSGHADGADENMVGTLVRNLQRRRDVSLGEGDAVRLRRLLASTVSAAPPRGRVLRNLTTKEYLRDSVLAEGGHDYSLGKAICVKVRYLDLTCFSHSWDMLTHMRQATWMDDAPGVPSPLIYKGAWAGHRFDIVALGNVEGEQGWSDVSARVLELMKRVCGRPC